MTTTPASFDEWYREQHPLVLAALTVASGRPHVAAESTDEAFVRAYERWSRVSRMPSPGGWLYRVALNDLRRRCRRQAVEHDLHRRAGAHRDRVVADPTTRIDPSLWAAVRALPDRQRTAVALRYVLDLPEPEIARVMGVTRGTVSASLVAARRRLEDELADDADPDPVPSGSTAHG